MSNERLCKMTELFSVNCCTWNRGEKLSHLTSLWNGTYDSLQSFLKVCGILQLAVAYLTITALLRRQMSLQVNVANSTMGCRTHGWNEHLEMSSCYSDMCPLTQPHNPGWLYPLCVEGALNGDVSTSPLVLKQAAYLSEVHLLNFLRSQMDLL